MFLTKNLFTVSLMVAVLLLVGLFVTSSTTYAVDANYHIFAVEPLGEDSTTAEELPENQIQENPIFKRLQQIINFLAIGVGIVITFSVVFAGFQYITSRGDPSKTKAAVERLWNAGIAVFLYVFMYIIIAWLIPGSAL